MKSIHSTPRLRNRATHTHNLTTNLRHQITDLRHHLSHDFTFDIIQDPDLLRAYAGQNYYKFFSRRFNIAGFFFSVLYLLFRKLYLAGIVIFLLDLLAINLIRDHVPYILPAFFLGLLVNLLLSLLVGFFVNQYYLFAAGYKIGRLKSRYPGRSHTELRGICTAKGGTNSLALTFGFLVKIISSVALVINMLFSDAFLLLDNSATDILKTIRTETEAVINELHSSLQSAGDNLRHLFDTSAHQAETDLRSNLETDLRQAENNK